MAPTTARHDGFARPDHAVLIEIDAQRQPRYRPVRCGGRRHRSAALTPAPGDRPVRFRVTLDGAVLGNSHGVDVDADAGVL